jgi:hypothetical protein
MLRKIPLLNSSDNSFVEEFGFEKQNYSEFYINRMIEIELQLEKGLLFILNELDFHAIVKNDRYSLPYKKQIKITIENFMYPDAYIFNSYFNRAVLDELYSKDISYKLRFFVFAEIEDFIPIGKLNIYFNYYDHS